MTFAGGPLRSQVWSRGSMTAMRRGHHQECAAVFNKGMYLAALGQRWSTRRV